MDKKWKCRICGYVHQGDAPPITCPICGAPADEFIAVEASRNEQQDN